MTPWRVLADSTGGTTTLISRTAVGAGTAAIAGWSRRRGRAPALRGTPRNWFSTEMELRWDAGGVLIDAVGVPAAH